MTILNTPGLVEKVWDGSEAHAGGYEGEIGKKNMSGSFTCQRNASPLVAYRRILRSVGHGRPSEECTTKGKRGTIFFLETWDEAEDEILRPHGQGRWHSTWVNTGSWTKRHVYHLTNNPPWQLAGKLCNRGSLEGHINNPKSRFALGLQGWDVR